MLSGFKKKILFLVNILSHFFKDHLAHIVFLVFAFQVLVAAGALPYFNLISQYSYYVFTAVWIIAVFLFKKQITSSLILRGIVAFFLIGIPTAMLRLTNFNDFLGFSIFVLIATGVIKKIIEDWSIISK
ncbi:MAG: hypothetical protein AAB583_06325 [Patescibacteria group bacterium]